MNFLEVSAVSVAKIEKVIERLLKGLKERPRSVLIKRFGLVNGDPMVLDKIGRDLNITRERVRQIESDSFKKLQKSVKGDDFNDIIERAEKILTFYGGFCEKTFLKESLRPNIKRKQRSSLMLILNSSLNLKYKKGNLKIGGFWAKKELSDVFKKIPVIHNHIVEFIKKRKKPSLISEIRDSFVDTEWNEMFSGDCGIRRLEMILRASQILNSNILGEWGLKNWKIISQRGARERAYLALKKNREPLHFREIAKHINNHWPDKKTLPQTVHNELIKDERFVLIGRGIYGLTGWGFSGGTVKEIIANLLKERTSAVDKDEIIEYVLSKKKVKKTTIMVTLADKVAFYRDGLGKFKLRK